MTVHTHKFKVGQTVALIPSMSRPGAGGDYEIISLRPTEGEESPRYRIKCKSEPHERVVAEADLVPAARLNFD
jgi:hypothetical protein